MSTTILAPTDFSQLSLERLRSSILFQKDTNMRVFLVHGVYLDDSITELLFFSENRLREELAGKQFLEGLNNLEEELKGCVDFIQVIFFKGRSQGQFNALVEAFGIDKILVPADIEFNWSHKRSMDMLPFFRKAKISKHASPQKHVVHEPETLIVSPST